jgi:magnesium chelatase family protein
MAKLSGPLLDRVDIRLNISAVSPAQMARARQESLTQIGRQQTSALLRNSVIEARIRAQARLKGTPWETNSQVPGAYLRKHFSLGGGVIERLERALAHGRLSMRGYDRCLRLAWSVADLAGRDKPSEVDVSKAIFLRGSEELIKGSHG